MSLNWPNLVAQGRAKDIGMPWSEEEQEAMNILIAHTGHPRNVIAPYIREGVLTVEQFDKATAPKTRKEVEKDAHEAGINFSEETPDTVLSAHVKKAKGSKKK
jgi:hypothetical protein